MNITKELLVKWGACQEGRDWFAGRPALHGQDFRVVCTALEADDQQDYSKWVRCHVAQFGNGRMSRFFFSRLDDSWRCQ